MLEGMPSDVAILSHSFRKGGASAAFAVGANTDRGIKLWGLWKQLSSVEAYVDRGYPCRKETETYVYLRALFDWLVEM